MAELASPETPATRAYVNHLGLRNKLARLLWGTAYASLFRFSPAPCIGWRRMLLRLFGAKMGPGSNVHGSTRVWAPWNLEMASDSCLAFGVDCYNVARVTLGAHATVSQYAHLCTASHDLSDPDRALVTAPIVLGESCWVFAGAFVGPGVTMGPGSVAAARAVVVKSVAPWQIVGGNPARFIKARILRPRPPGTSGPFDPDAILPSNP